MGVTNIHRSTAVFATFIAALKDKIMINHGWHSAT
jgi:hypothetical protein